LSCYCPRQRCTEPWRSLAPLIRGHHERWDGQGYPDQLAGPHIPLGARLLAVADAYSALIGGGRATQPACSPIEAVQALQRRAGTQFDPHVIKALVRLVQEQHGRVPTSVAQAAD
jgi:HD-GYP domain-containing protein (c-di-GMP phosphodiesterase class II)